MPIIIAFIIIISGIFVTANVADKVLQKQITSFQPTPTASPTPTPTSVPQVKVNQVAPPPYDPIIDCGTDSQRQKGITTSKVKKSTCDSWVDCQMGFGLAVRVPKEKCDALINCQVGDIATKTTSVEECEQRKGKVSVGQQSGLINCQTQSGWQRMSQDDCTKAQNAWKSQIQSQQNDVENAMRTLAGLDAESWGAENLDQLDNIRERVRQVQSPDPSVQAYANQIISFIEIRIKQAQGN